jgi:hypothetical protein
MGTIKRLNDQQKQQAQAEAAMPGAYENRYDEGIQNALAGMDSANSAGLGFDSQNGTYRGALSRLFGNAGAGASAAEQVANSLSGGYGTDWAKSAAQQAAAGETGQTANVYAQARADALSQWQQELAGRGTQLDNLLTQDQLARSEYDGSVQNAADWRSYRYDRTQQARQENSDFLSNVWNVIKNVGSDVGKAYNAYMGYSQQKANAIVQAKEEYRNGNVDGAKAILKMYRMDENMFDNLQGVSDFTVQQNAALKEAYEMLDQGAPEAAISKFLEPYDLSYDMFDEWKGLSKTDKDNLDYLMKAQDYTTAGAPTLGQTIARAVGYGTDALDSFDSVTNRLNQADLAKYASQLAISNRYKTTTGTGRGSGGKNSNQNTNKQSNKTDGYTQPQLNTMLKAYNSMKPDDKSYSYYTDVLADGGRIDRLSGVGNPGKANGTAWEQGMYNARKMANSGYSQNQIASELANNTSLSSDQISAIMNQIDYEWRGTK